MRKLFVTIAAAAAILSAGSLANRADAMTVGDSAGLRAALADGAVVDQVHCVPGWRHHRWWNGRPHSDGCGVGIVIGPRWHGRYWRGRGWRGGHGHWRGGGGHWRGGHGGHGHGHHR